MAQITGAISSREFKIEISANGSSWTDVSGTAAKVTPTPRKRMSGKAFTFDGDVPIVSAGKLDAMTIGVEFVYTEGASDLFEVIRAAQEAATNYYVRWSPKGGQTGEFLYTTASGVITSFDLPKGDAGSGDPVICSFELETPGVTKSAAA